LPADIAVGLGREFAVVSLRTNDLVAAKIFSARIYFSLSRVYAEIRVTMARLFNIDDPNGTRLLAERLFELGREFEIRKQLLNEEFELRKEQIIQAVFAEHRQSPAPELLDMAAINTTSSPEPVSIDRCLSMSVETPSASAILKGVNCEGTKKLTKANKPWTELTADFLKDRPGLGQKALVSYEQSFREWKIVIGEKQIGEIGRGDVKSFADYLRDKANIRGGTLSRKTIVRSLGSIKLFMAWAVRSGFTPKDDFELVVAREKTKEERLQKKKIRAFKVDELQKLFTNPAFGSPTEYFSANDYWFFLLGYLTGARLDELALAPTRFENIGGIRCLDLRISGTKTEAAPRLIPIHRDLVRLGIFEWANAQAARGYRLLQPALLDRNEKAWSKRLNRRINRFITDDETVVFHSFRHSFRQSLRAAKLGEELIDKIFGHAPRTTGEEYGTDLSPDEAALFLRDFKPPVPLAHLQQILLTPR